MKWMFTFAALVLAPFSAAKLAAAPWHELTFGEIAGAAYVVRIPMAHGVDSLNVAAAAAVAFWQLRV